MMQQTMRPCGAHYDTTGTYLPGFRQLHLQRPQSRTQPPAGAQPDQGIAFLSRDALAQNYLDMNGNQTRLAGRSR